MPPIWSIGIAGSETHLADALSGLLTNPAERATLELTEAMSFTPAAVSDALFADMQNHFSEEQMVELAATIAMENYRARINRVFLLASEGRNQPQS